MYKYKSFRRINTIRTLYQKYYFGKGSDIFGIKMGIPSFTSKSILHDSQFNLDAFTSSLSKFLHCGHERMFSTIFYPSNRPSYTLWGYP
jgi:hypothetical protein